MADAQRRLRSLSERCERRDQQRGKEHLPSKAVRPMKYGGVATDPPGRGAQLCGDRGGRRSCGEDAGSRTRLRGERSTQLAGERLSKSEDAGRGGSPRGSNSPNGAS
ncbi:hypothetical protein AGIG_G20738 [Arapaima gigas]